MIIFFLTLLTSGSKTDTQQMNKCEYAWTSKLFLHHNKLIFLKVCLFKRVTQRGGGEETETFHPLVYFPDDSGPCGSQEPGASAYGSNLLGHLPLLSPGH